MEPAPTTTRRGAPLLSRAELCAMALTAGVATGVSVLVALPRDRDASAPRILLLIVLTFFGIVFGSELAEHWESAQGHKRAVIRGYGVAIPVLVTVLVLAFLI